MYVLFKWYVLSMLAVAICFGATVQLLVVYNVASVTIWLEFVILSVVKMSASKVEVNEKQIFVRNLPFDVTSEV